MKKLFSIVLTLIIAIAPVMVNVATADAKDYYRSFSKLAKHQTRGEDYYISKYDGPSNTAVIAIHAGQIELQTGELAATIADWTGSDLYTFEGIKNRNNGVLHVTSTRFNEPIARNLVAQSDVTLSIHGCKGKQAVTYIGGQDKDLGKKIKASLKDAGFKVVTPPKRLNGKNPKNICNKNASAKGVQLELTVPLRKQFVSDSGPTDTFYRYAAAVSKALQE
jgi:phage replication-related protein YjqB (UPF0714/DUF867 family)